MIKQKFRFDTNKEKPVVEEQSDSSISNIPDDDHDSNNVVEQYSNSAGGKIRSTISVLTGPV